MYPAQSKLYIKIATPILGVASLFIMASPVLADTTVGEYLYDDSYLPITSATCILNVKNPDGTDNITDQALVSTTDGWYGDTFTSPTTVGYYRAEICCDSGSDHLCIDKSFEISAATSSSPAPSTSDISTAVWGYSGRTLTGFNNIVADVWSYATRKLTSGENITVTVSSTEINAIKNTANETRLLVEELVNKPIIENSLEEVGDVDLGEKIEESKTVANEIYINLLYLNSSFIKVNKNWSSLSDREILDILAESKNLIGNESDSSSDDSFFGRINFLKSTWGLKESDDLKEEINSVYESIVFIEAGVSSYGKSKTMQKEVSSLASYLSSSEKTLSLLNKKMTEYEAVSITIDSNLSKISGVLGSWDENKYLEAKSEIDLISKNVLAINKVPKGSLIIEPRYSDITGAKKIKNKALALRALLLTNKKLMLNGQKLALSANWMEEGSIVIKTLITNPSILISQDVPLKYYLPRELKKEHIIETDTGVEVKYDTEKDQLYVEGNFTLRAGETKTVSVRVQDVWQISETEINSLSKQAEDLGETLKNTSYFAQGVTLKSEIDINLARAGDFLKDGITPEAKIKSYREAQIEIVSAKEKLERLKELVSLASSSGSILGFVGGSQAIAVWGIVIAIATGFVFMTIYMKRLLGIEAKKVNVKATQEINKQGKANGFDKLAVFLVVATISGLSSSIVVKKMVLPVYANQSKEVLGTTTIDYKTIKIVNLVDISGVVKTYQNETDEAVLEIVDSGKMAVEIERGEKRVKVVFDQKEAFVDPQNVLSELNR